MIIYNEKKIFFLPCNVEKLWCVHSENIIVHTVFFFYEIYNKFFSFEDCWNCFFQKQFKSPIDFFDFLS